MKPSQDLFDLVTALSKTEKRYVSLYLSTSFHGSNKNSLRLFQAVSQQETYNETALKKRLGKSIAARFSAEKNKLFELILDSMLLYYRDRTEEKKINALRYEAAFLFSKNLRMTGWKYLRKAQSLSEISESFANGVQLAYRENQEVRKAALGEVTFVAEESLARNRRLIQMLGEDLELVTLYTEIIQLEKRYGTVTGPGKAMESLKKIINHPLVNAARTLEAFSSNTHRLEIRGVYYKMIGDEHAAFRCCNELVALYEESPANIAQGYGRYADALLNRLQGALIIRDYKAFDQLLVPTRKSLEGMKKYFGFHIDLIIFYGPELLELLALTTRADAKRGPAFLAHMEKRFKFYRDSLGEGMRITALYLLGTYHFYLGNLNKALAFYNDLTDTTSPNEGQNYQCMVRLVKLLLHYDLGHEDLLPSLAASVSRLLTKHGRLGPMEKQLIAFFKKAPSKDDKQQLKELRTAIQKTGSKDHNYGTWCGFAFDAWMRSRIEKKPLHEFVSMGV
ncbi:MAG TPA: hypothetical protein VK826_07705 [Bacteroidia bacterium]|nr:hypothetical protein [Bacteroidia bacterium]